MIRVAVIGVGSIAKLAHLPTLLAAECEISGVMSSSGSTAHTIARRYNIPRVYESLDEIQADCAFVLSPKETHACIAARLLRNGLHVFLEKPMATKLSDAEELVRVAKDHERVLMIGFNRRYAPCYEALKEAWKAGEPDVLIAEKSRPGTDYRATLENAVHMVDLMRWVCGEAKEVTGASQFDDPFHETSCVAQIRFARTLGVFVVNRSCGQWVERVASYGSGKSVISDSLERLSVADHAQTHETSLTPLAMAGVESARDKMGYRQEVDDFLKAVAGTSTVRTPGSDALETHRLMHRVLVAAGLPGMDA